MYFILLLYVVALDLGSKDAGYAFVIGWSTITIVMVICIFLVYSGNLRRYRDLIIGTTLFILSPASIYLIYFILANSKIIDILGPTGQDRDPSAASDTSAFAAVLLFSIGVALNELTLAVMGKTRLYPS